MEPAYELTVTLLLGEGMYLGWEGKEAFARFLEPLVASLGNLAKFTVDLQVRHNAAPGGSLRTVQLEGEAVQIVNPNDFLRSGDWNLHSSVGKAQPIELIVYVPERPVYATLEPLDPDDLTIDSKDEVTSSFVYPKWGAVYLYNRPRFSDSTITADELALPFAALAGHLRSLLGIGYPHPAHWVDGKAFDAGWTWSEAGSTGIAPWELDSLLARHAAHAYEQTLETLAALGRLVAAIPELPVEAELKARIDQALLGLSHARKALSEGQLELGHQQALEALQVARQVFYDPSMVGRLYFSQDHKFGVYLPIFAPILPALLAALLRQLRRKVSKN